MRVIFLVFFSLLSFPSWSNGQVSSIKSSTEIITDLFDASGFWVKRKVLIVSRESDKAVGFGTVTEIHEDVSPRIAIIMVEEIINNSLISPGDIVYPLEYEILKEKNVPGFSSLTLQGDNDIPAKYKELAYFGVFTSEGHTLDMQEFMVSPFQLQYGFTNDFGVKLVNALWLDGYANFGLKYRALRNKYAKITVNTLGAYKVQSQDWIWQLGAVVTLPSNAKFQNHLMVNITVDKQYEDAKATRDLGLFQDSDIRSITEYVTDDWNRILYGVAYNVELQAFGGTASYMWIWDSFHTSLGIATKDFSSLTFNREAYYYVYDFFWRF